jgi:hypothetical protein
LYTPSLADKVKDRSLEEILDVANIFFNECLRILSGAENFLSHFSTMFLKPSLYLIEPPNKCPVNQGYIITDLYFLPRNESMMKLNIYANYEASSFMDASPTYIIGSGISFVPNTYLPIGPSSDLNVVLDCLNQDAECIFDYSIEWQCIDIGGSWITTPATTTCSRPLCPHVNNTCNLAVKPTRIDTEICLNGEAVNRNNEIAKFGSETPCRKTVPDNYGDSISYIYFFKISRD